MKYFLAILGLMAMPANAAVLWNIGEDDNAQDGNGDPADGLNDTATFDGTPFMVSGVRETGLQDLPGNPANTGGPDGDANRDVDDDYYFAGVYNTVVDGGAYVPVGIVADHESYYDRALTAGDPNMRWHFNLPDSVPAEPNFTFTIDFHNLSETNAGDLSTYDLTFWVNGNQIGEMQPHTDFDLAAAQSWNFTLEDLGGLGQVGSGFDHYVEIRSTPTGSARWSSLDYVQLEVSADPIVEDDPNISVAAAVNFGDIQVGGAEATQPLVITNSGETQDLVITDLALGGDNPGSFAINAPALPITIAPGADATIDVTVTPGDIEASLSSTLTVTSNDPSDGSQIVVLAARIFIPFSDEGTLWFLGVDDDTQDGNGDASLNDPAFFNGIDFFASGVQESGMDFLPGNPDSQGGAGAGRDVDDDYYFAGLYETVVDGGVYDPVGIVAANERYYDRALTNGDPNMRWHFNLPNTVGPNDAFTFTIDFYNLDDDSAPEVSGYDLTFFVDGQQIGDTQSHTDDNLDAAQSWDFTLDDLGGVAELGPGFDHYVEVRSTPTGSSRWSSLDYAKLDIDAGANTPFVITDVVSDGASTTFTWNSKIGQFYILEHSNDLDTWDEITDGFPDGGASEETTSYTDTEQTPQDGMHYFRVREEL